MFTSAQGLRAQSIRLRLLCSPTSGMTYGLRIKPESLSAKKAVVSRVKRKGQLCDGDHRQVGGSPARSSDAHGALKCWFTKITSASRTSASQRSGHSLTSYGVKAYCLLASGANGQAGAFRPPPFALLVFPRS